MPRWSQHAEDSFRLPEGFRRIGYDADTMRYTFTDKHGKLYRGAPGEEYGTLTPVSFSASTDRPGAFSDGENPKVTDSSANSARGPAPKLTFSDFLPPSAMTSASSPPDQNLPATPPKAHFNGGMRTALPKMGGVMQSLRRTITSAYTNTGKGSTSTGTAAHGSPPREGDKISTPNMSNAVGASPASISIARVDKPKSSADEPKV